MSDDKSSLSFLDELKRRRVVRMALVYGSVAFVTLQVADLVFPLLSIPDWGLGLTFGILLVGFPVALVLAWAYQVTPDGVRRTAAVHDGGVALARPVEWLPLRTVLLTAALILLGAAIGWLVKPQALRAGAESDAQNTPFPASSGAIRLLVLPPAHMFFESWAISADGGRVVFAVSDSIGRRHLRVRALHSVRDQPLQGTEGATQPFWSPDGQFIAFFADGKLKKVAAAGGLPQTLANASDPFGGSWHRNGTILFTPTHAGAIYRVGATGGEVAPASRLDFSRQESGHFFPQFLPDGQHFIFYAERGWPERSGAFIGSLDSDETTPLPVQGSVLYATGAGDTGHLLFVREDILMAQPFDPARRTLTGEAFAVAESPGFFSVSENGVLVHGSSTSTSTQFTWFDRTGRQLGVVGGRATQDAPQLSPDGTRLAVTRTTEGNTDIWIHDAHRGTETRFTFHAAGDMLPIWSPDGRHIVFFSNRDGVWTLYRKPVSGATEEELLLKTTSPQVWPVSWSPDGRYLLYGETDPDTHWDLWLLENPLGPAGERRTLPFLRTPAYEDYAQFSPDGRWIAYHSTESGRYEVYVRPFRPETAGQIGAEGAPPGGRWQVSGSGGYQPRWRGDGRELFFLAGDGMLTAVPVRAGDGFEAGPERPLFQAWAHGYARYDAAPDGTRFLVNRTFEQDATPATVVLNWPAGLR